MQPGSFGSTSGHFGAEKLFDRISKRQTSLLCNMEYIPPLLALVAPREVCTWSRHPMEFGLDKYRCGVYAQLSRPACVLAKVQGNHLFATD